MRRKKWSTPQLVVLVRGKPEEGVLAACKYSNKSGATQAAYNAQYCVSGYCAQCNVFAAS